MLVKDSSLQDRHTDLNDAEKFRHTTDLLIQDQLKDAKFVANPETDPTNAERQLGRPLHVDEVERRLKKLCPQLLFEPHPYKTSKKIMFHINPHGNKRTVMPYENGIIPERSVLQAVIKETLDPAVVRSQFHIDRADLTKHEVHPHIFNEAGELKELGNVEWDPTVPMLGMQRTKIPWCESIRGYRTMLVILVHAGLITGTQAEQAFGSDNRPEWQKHLGKKHHNLPW